MISEQLPADVDALDVLPLYLCVSDGDYMGIGVSYVHQDRTAWWRAFVAE